MSNTCRRNNTYFIDEHNGFNNGYCVNDIKEVLRKMGVVRFRLISLMLRMSPIRILPMLLILCIVL